MVFTAQESPPVLATPAPSRTPSPPQILSPPVTTDATVDGATTQAAAPRPLHHYSHNHRSKHMPSLLGNLSLHLTPAELIEVRALQRTFEGAYIRTALSQFSFALLVLKIFSREFYGVGALFAVFGICVFCVSILRRREGNKQFFVQVHEEKVSDVGTGVGGDGSGEGGEQMIMSARAVGERAAAGAGIRVKANAERMFRTSGNAVCAITVVSAFAYVALLVLVWRLGN